MDQFLQLISDDKIFQLLALLNAHSIIGPTEQPVFSKMYSTINFGWLGRFDKSNL